MNKPVIAAIVALIFLVYIFGFQSATIYGDIDTSTTELVNQDAYSATYQWNFKGYYDQGSCRVNEDYISITSNKIYSMQKQPIFVEGLQTNKYVDGKVYINGLAATINPCASAAVTRSADVDYSDVKASCKLNEGGIFSSEKKAILTCKIEGPLYAMENGKRVTGASVNGQPSGAVTVTFLKEGYECAPSVPCESGSCVDGKCVADGTQENTDDSTNDNDDIPDNEEPAKKNIFMQIEEAIRNFFSRIVGVFR